MTNRKTTTEILFSTSEARSWKYGGVTETRFDPVIKEYCCYELSRPPKNQSKITTYPPTANLQYQQRTTNK